MSADPIIVENEEKVSSLPKNSAMKEADVNKTVMIRANGATEHVSSSDLLTSQWFSGYPRTLPFPIDDITRDFGDDLYDRMALDPKIAQTLAVLKTGIIEEGMILTAPVTDQSDPRSKPAAEILKAAQSMLQNLDMDVDALLWNMLAGLHLGNKVSELVFGYVEEDGKVRIDVRKIHVKPRNSLAFVIDSFGNIVGFVALIPGNANTVLQNSYVDLKKTENLLPRDKFWVFTNRQEDQDPRGTSILRPAYEFWNIKHQVIREYLKYLTQFASASLFATTPEGAEVQKERDANGVATGNVIDPWAVMRTALEAFRNGSVMTAPFGTELKEIFSQGDGTAFSKAIDFLTREMVSSILGQTLASEEGEHQSRSASSVHQNILASIIRQLKRTLCFSIRKDILVPWVERNWGTEFKNLAPEVSLGETETPNLPQLMTAVANLFNSTYLSPTQLAGVDKLLNLSQRSPEEYQSIIEFYKARMAQAQTMPDQGGTNVKTSDKNVKPGGDNAGK